jgi:DNA polymerase-3 subunit delta
VKLAGAQIARFIARPPDETAAILLFGPDGGLVKERAQALVRVILGEAADDPFRLAVLDAKAVLDDPARLPDEAAQLSLIGGRRVVRVREATDALAKPLAQVLAGRPGGALVVVEAGDLAASGALRKLAEAAGNAAAIGCYPDGPGEIAQLIRDTAQQHRVRIADDAVEYLVQSLGGDRLGTRQELDKLMLFAGDGGSVSLDEAVASVGDSSDLAVDDVVYDAFDGAGSAAEAGLGRLFLEGESAVAVLRAAQRQAHRLHQGASRIAAGESEDSVLRGLRLFTKQIPRFKAQLRRWPATRIARILPQLTQAELDCKSTGYPDETICRRVLSGIARLAAARP